MDDAYTGKLAFLKIDVEGHERAVIDGAIHTIGRCHPNLLIEIEERFANNAIDETRQFLATMGYNGYFIDHGHRKDISLFESQSMQRQEDIAESGGGKERMLFASYVNNFIFIHYRKTPHILPKLDVALAKQSRSLFTASL